MWKPNSIRNLIQTDRPKTLCDWLVLFDWLGAPSIKYKFETHSQWSFGFWEKNRFSENFDDYCLLKWMYQIRVDYYSKFWLWFQMSLHRILELQIAKPKRWLYISCFKLMTAMTILGCYLVPFWYFQFRKLPTRSFYVILFKVLPYSMVHTQGTVFLLSKMTLPLQAARVSLYGLFAHASFLRRTLTIIFPSCELAIMAETPKIWETNKPQFEVTVFT